MKSNSEIVLANFLSRGISAAYSSGSSTISVERGCIPGGDSPHDIISLKREIESETGTRICWCDKDEKNYLIRTYSK